MDKQTVEIILENVYSFDEAAKYMKLSRSQLHILVENGKLSPLKNNLFYKGDLDDYLQNSYSLNRKNVKEAVFYYTMQTFLHDDELETLHVLNTLEIEKNFNLHHAFLENMTIVCSYLHILESVFCKQYSEMEAHFMNLPINTIILSKEDALYPVSLKDEANAPYFLFVQGKIELLDHHCIGMIGSFHPRDEEISKSLYLCNHLVSKDYTIVSTLERGINTYIALELMKNQKSGIFVLDCSFLDFYPKENKQIYEYMAGSGLVITPFIYHSPGMHKRVNNLIFSAISRHCILMGGKDHDESTNAGYEIIRQNKKLLLPSQLKKSYLKFPNDMIKAGAHYFSSLKELYSYLK